MIRVCAFANENGKMEKGKYGVKKLKFLSLIAVAILSSIVFVGCSCSKEIDPISITINPSTQETFIDTSYTISFAIYPQNATNTSVNIGSSDTSVVTVAKSNIDSANSSVLVTTVGEGSATITFSINGTEIKAVHTVTVYNPAPLTTPSNLQYDDETGQVVFLSVANATEYELDINGTKTTISDPTPNLVTAHNIVYQAFGTNGNLTTGTEYSAKVQAIGDGKYYTNSTYGDYETAPVQFLKLAPPTNLVVAQNVVTWDHSPYYLADETNTSQPATNNYVGYIVTVNGVAQPVQTQNSFTVTIGGAGTYTLTVQAVVTDEEETTVFNSVQSSSVEIVKLEQVTGLAISNTETENDLRANAVFSWSAVTGATSYQISVSPALLDEGTTFNVLSTDSLQLEIDNRFANGQTYTLSVVAKEQASNVIASEATTYTFTKLDVVSNTHLTENVLYFDVLTVTAQVQYEVVLTHEGVSTRHVVAGGSLNLADITSDDGAYAVSIRSLAFHDVASQTYYANSALLDTEVTFQKLIAPIVSKINNDSTLYWALVENASGYDIYFDDGLVTTISAENVVTVNEQGTYQLSNMATISAGAHTVAVVALGTGVPNVISSTVADKNNFSFSKLTKPTNMEVANDVISWDEITGAYFYAVGENTTTLTSIGGVANYTIATPLASNTIYVVAGGNDVNIISSDVTTFLVNKLLSPANVRTENGVLYFDYDANNYYKLYVNGVDLGVTIENGTYAFTNNLQTGQVSQIGVKAFAKSEIEGNTFLSSDITLVNLEKLTAPINIVNNKNVGTETYTLSWDAVANTSNYHIIITPVNTGDTSEMTLSVTQSETTYDIPSNWAKGLFSVQVVAIGNTTSLMSSETGYMTSATSAEYDIVKLSAPTNVRVNDGTVAWTASTNPNSAVPAEYELRVVYNSSTSYYTTTQTSYNLETLSGDYTISVRAIGPATQNMTSEWSVENVISKLNLVDNVRVTTGGVIAWDAYNTTYGTGLSVVYDLYLTTFETGTRQLLESGYTQTSYIITESISTDTNHVFEVVARADSYLNSDYSNAFTFQKLGAVTDFAISNSVFSWSATTNVQGYEILNTTNGVNSVYVNTDNITFSANFNEGGTLDSGTYTFKMRAIGGNDGSTNYVNGDYTPNLTVTILSAVTGMSVSSGMLQWNLSYGAGEELNTPLRYDIYIYEALEGGGYASAVVHSVANTATQYDLSSLGSGDYRIEIVSVGNTIDKLDSDVAVLELVSKPDATEINLRAENGVIMWDVFSGTNVSYELYLDDVSLETITQTSYVVTGLTPMQQYTFKILVHADGYLTSAYSNELSIVKLPNVQNFEINANVVGQPHYFSWDLVENASVEIAEGYEIVPTTTLAEFNGGANKSESTLNFGVTTAGTYYFQIRAIGSTNNSGITYLTSDFGNTVMVVVLDTVQNISVQNNALTYEASTMFADADTTPDSFLIEVYSVDEFGAEVLQASKTLTSTYVWDMKVDGTLLPSGVYNVKIYSVGTQDFKVTSAAEILENVTILAMPSDIRVNQGLVDFGLSDVTGIVVSYEVWVNGGLLVTLTDNTEDQVKLINEAISTTGTSQTLKVRAIATNAIYSVYSNEITISKLPSVTGANIALNSNVSTLYWNEIANASLYRLTISPYAEVFDDLPYYNATRNWFELTMAGTEGFVLPTNLPAGGYTYAFVAVGNTTVAGSASVGYLTSNPNTDQTFAIMDAPSGLRLEQGIIRWDSTAGAVNYRLEFYATDTVDELTPIFKTVNTSSLQYDMNTSEFVAGNYTLYIYALGDGVQYISSTIHDEMLIIRNEAPSNFKILNGLLSWTVSENDILLATTRETTQTLSSPDLILLDQIFSGETDGVSSALLKNLSWLYNMELTINGVKYNVTPTTFEYNLGIFTMYYDVNLPAGTYIMSMRGVGNTPANADGEGLTLSVIDTEALDVVYNYAYTFSTTELSAYKLSSPITPVYPQTTSIVDNKFYWSPVTNNSSETMLNYYIIAQSKAGTTDNIVDLVTIEVGENSPFIDIRDIADETTTNTIPAGFVYNISVIAQGTLDSELNVGTNYLSSSYTNISEVQILKEPSALKVLNGVVSFSQNLNATTHLLHVWNNGSTYDEAISDVQNGYIKREVEINLTLEATDEYLTFLDGIYYYSLEDNPLFPATDDAYLVSVLAVGDGVTVISAEETTTITVGKWSSAALEGADEVTIESGMFKWKNVSFQHPVTLETVYPENYKVVITRSSVVEEDQVTQIIYNTAQTTDPYIYFELPDTDAYPATVIDNGSTYYYSYQIVVSAYGTISGESGNVQFATSNTATSRIGSRLEAPVNLTTVLGEIQWNAVQYAAGYDIYISEVYLNDYEITNLGNVIAFDLDSGFESGTYTIKVRANSNSNSYLNSRQSGEIRAVKLDTPNLRLESGLTKWNNTSLPFALTNYTLLSITGPVGFVGWDIEGLEETDFTVNGSTYTTQVAYDDAMNTAQGLNLKGTSAGEYNISVQYVGSTGSVLSGEDEYFLVNSDSIDFTFTKLDAPVISTASSEDENGITNYVSWAEVSYATDYNVVVIKLNESDEIIKTVKFNYKVSNQYFEVVSTDIHFDLQAVTDYDDNNPDLDAFGDDYSVYVEAFGDNSFATSLESRYSMSNNSNVTPITIPLMPSDLALDEYGTIIWTNRSNATPVLEISYLDGAEYTTPTLIELTAGTDSYKLTVISNDYKVRIKAITGTLGGIIAQSSFSEIVSGAFNLFASGTGTQADPYTIVNAQHLFNINYYPNAEFSISNDIDTSLYAGLSEWKPIGVENIALDIVQSEFMGVLNGNGYTISTIQFTGTVQNELGFIHTIGATGEINNLTINLLATNLNVGAFGGVAVYNYGTISGVTLTGSVHLLNSRVDTYAGGVAVYNYSGATITNTVNNANIISSTNNSTNTNSVGGIVYQNQGTLSQVGNNGTLTGTSVGGVAYMNQSVVTQSYNKGIINAVANAEYQRDMYVGGIVAVNESGASLSSSYVWVYETINITNNSTRTAYVGGLMGSNGSQSTISNSYAVYKIGTVSGTGTVQAGAIAGNSTYYTSNYDNIYYQDIGTTLLPLGNRASSVTGITMYTQTQMQQPAFVSALVNYFIAVTNDYPVLSWE